jgi:signal recognition particle subunit SRP54
MGDVLTLIEQAEKAFDKDEAEQMAAKLLGSRRRVHPRGLPRPDAGRPQDGPARQAARDAARDGQMREQIDSIDEKEIDRIEAIIRSMTPAERANPKILNGSRRARIAKGSAKKGRTAPASKKKGRGVSGNPAKRSLPKDAPEVAAKAPDPSVFGSSAMPTTEAELAEAMKGFQLPPEMQQFLNPQNKGPR